MQEGSIVVMTKAIDEGTYVSIAYYTGIAPPKPGDTQYMVIASADENILRLMSSALGKEVKVGIYLDAYPDYVNTKTALDADLFTELLPPNLNVDRLLESDKIPEKNPVLQVV